MSLLLALVSAALLMATTAHATEPMDLDGTFGTGGSVVGSFTSSSEGYEATARTSTGEIVAVGGTGSPADVMVARYTAAGALDPSFSVDGKATFDIAGWFDYGHAVTVQSDDKIVIVGTTVAGAGQDSNMLVMRLTTTGVLDTSFSGDGIMAIDLVSLTSNNVDYGTAVAMDGTNIIAGGTSEDQVNDFPDFAVAKISSTGVLDTSFHADGIAVTSVDTLQDQLTSLAVDPDGKIVAAGYAQQGLDYHAAAVRYTTSGALDTAGFGLNGKVILPLNSVADDRFFAMRRLGDGTYVLAGQSDGALGKDVLVAKLTSAGVLDVSFSSDGLLLVDVRHHSNDIARALDVDPDGRIIIAGEATSGDARPSHDLLIRLTSAGALDTTFDLDGIARRRKGSFGSKLYGVLVQPDGAIVTAGYVLTSGNQHNTSISRFVGGTGSAPPAPPVHPTVPLDTAFSADGKVMTDVSAGGDDVVAAATLTTDGKIVVAGFATIGGVSNIAVAKYLTTGALDTAFSGDGMATLANGAFGVHATSIDIDSLGRVVVAGCSQTGSGNDMVVARFTSAGTPDATFDTAGLLMNAFGAGDDCANGVAVDSLDRIIAAGHATTGNDSDAALMRITAAGVLDTTFSVDGMHTVDLGDNNDEITAIQIDSTGRYLLAGHTFGASNTTDIALVRMDPAATLDPTFDGDGMVVTSTTGTGEMVRALQIDASNGNTIAVAGYAVEEPGDGDEDLFAARYTDAGAPDTSFSVDGRVQQNYNGESDEADAVAVQTGGAILSAGHITVERGESLGLYRHTSTGVLDTTFDNDGIAHTSVGVGNDRAHALIALSNGHIIAAGSADNGTDLDFAVIRIGATLAGPPPAPPSQLARVASPRQGRSYGGRRFRTLRGTAEATSTSITKVQLAVRYTTRRGTPCRWVRNRDGELKSVSRRGGACNRHVWLRATGTTSWSWKLRRRLPAGRYTIYARAISAAGTETAFQNGRNVITFRVR